MASSNSSTEISVSAQMAAEVELINAQDASNNELADKAVHQFREAGFTDEDVPPPAMLEVLDMAILGNPQCPAFPAEVARLRHSLLTTGFFSLTNLVGFDFNKVQRLKQLTGVVGGLPLDQLKALKCTSPLGQGMTRLSHGFNYTFGPPEWGQNKYPEGQEEFKALVAYYYGMMEVNESMMYTAIALALGFPYEKRTVIRDALGTHRGLMSLNYGPNSGEHIRNWGAHHCDFGTLTILYPDHGLLVVPRDVGEYRSVEVSNGSTFVVNIGDCLERYTGRRLISTVHTVRFWKDVERISLVFFAGQALDEACRTRIGCLLPEGMKPVLDLPSVDHGVFVTTKWSNFLHKYNNFYVPPAEKGSSNQQAGSSKSSKAAQQHPQPVQQSRM